MNASAQEGPFSPVVVQVAHFHLSSSLFFFLACIFPLHAADAAAIVRARCEAAPTQWVKCEPGGAAPLSPLFSSNVVSIPILVASSFLSAICRLKRPANVIHTAFPTQHSVFRLCPLQLWIFSLVSVLRAPLIAFLSPRSSIHAGQPEYRGPFIARTPESCRSRIASADCVRTNLSSTPLLQPGCWDTPPVLLRRFHLCTYSVGRQFFPWKEPVPSSSPCVAATLLANCS
ncbi:hypothetical protein C8J57DRAFT_1581401 [Mycena rebaudengoi]|nr:hypothetical protein C8J57DRAFT_1581401 [Mycena rebaudengoi]